MIAPSLAPATSMDSAFGYETYAWRGGTEWMLAHGPADGPQIVVLQPLFEEASYTRAVLVQAARLLAEQGIGTLIPDLPGTGESLVALEAVSLDDWQAAADAAIAAGARRGARPPHVAALRGGALLDGGAAHLASRWRFAPASGASLLRQMERAQQIGDRESGRTPSISDAHVELVGYRLRRELGAALRSAVVSEPAEPCRIFSHDGFAPWRRAEPTPDAALSHAIATDLASWIRQCAGR